MNSIIGMGILKLAIELNKDGKSNDKIRKYTGLTDDEIDGLTQFS